MNFDSLLNTYWTLGATGKLVQLLHFADFTNTPKDKKQPVYPVTVVIKDMATGLVFTQLHYTFMRDYQLQKELV